MGGGPGRNGLRRRRREAVGRSFTGNPRRALVLNALLSALPAVWLALLWIGSYLKSFRD